MKVAVVYNRESANVINLFGRPNREKIGLKTIQRVVSALKDGGHQVIALEGDKDLIDRLEDFMPRVIKGERPGLVFNVSYGIQGQARYTHVPSILEMIGIPYVASGPLAHSLALDKVVTKMILRQHGLPTPDFAVLQTPASPVPELTYPLIVKPKNEAVSFGLKVVQDEAELRAASKIIFDEFGQAVLAEQFIEGREVNVGLLGNDPPEAFPPVELLFGEGGPGIYTYEDKTGKSGRTISHRCPAAISDALLARACEISTQAFTALGCYDCARVDMRLDAADNLYILEINSLPSLGEHGSYLIGAEKVGLDFPKFINRLVEVASARYFGSPSPPSLATSKAAPAEQVFSFITSRRDLMERQLKQWVALPSRTDDALGIQQATTRAAEIFEGLGMMRVDALSDTRTVSTWETSKGFDDGMLFLVNLDVPVHGEFPMQTLRREPEWLYGEGVGSSRAPLVMLEFACRALRSTRRLRQLPLGVLCYTDEGQDGRYSAALVREATARAREVFVLRPASALHGIVTERWGQRTYRLLVEANSQRVGTVHKRPDPLRWTAAKLEEIASLGSKPRRLSVATTDIRADHMPMHLPHRVTAMMVMTYPITELAEATEERMRAILGKGGPRWELSVRTDRPPFVARPAGLALADELEAVGANLDLPLKRQHSNWPSVAGLVRADQACVCGIGPEARDLRTPQEAVQRTSFIQRTLLLAQFLASRLPARDGGQPTS